MLAKSEILSPQLQVLFLPNIKFTCKYLIFSNLSSQITPKG